jgi:hypothetical protein
MTSRIGFEPRIASHFARSLVSLSINSAISRRTPSARRMVSSFSPSAASNWRTWNFDRILSAKPISATFDP